MKKTIVLTYIFVFLFTILQIPNQVYAETELNLTSKAYILIDMQTGQVLAEKNADQKWSPASTTKIMTALLAIENSQLTDEMPASAQAINSIGYDYVTAGIKPGEILNLQALLELMLITSANEAGYVIAENVAPDGTIAGFANMMNQKAAELGLTGSHFTNPCGIEDPNHYSTARDLAMLGREAMKLEAFRNIVGKLETIPPETNLRKQNEWPSSLSYTNKLLKSRSKYYTQVTGIKTGYTDLAGRCLVSSAVDDTGLELISVVLGADTYDILFAESQKLLEYGYANYSLQDVIKSGQYVERLDVEDAVEAKQVELLTQGDIRCILPTNPELLKTDLTNQKTLNQPFKAPVAKGQELGKIEYFYKGKSIGTVSLVAKEAIDKTMMAQLRDKYFEIVHDKRVILGLKIAGGAIVFLIILRIVLRTISRRSNKRRRYYTPSRKNSFRL